MNGIHDIVMKAQALVDAMETCHICHGTVLVDNDPVHCEDCSYDCDNHDEPPCKTLYDLHRELKIALDGEDRLYKEEL